MLFFAIASLFIVSVHASDCPMPIPAEIFDSQLSDVQKALDSKSLNQLSSRFAELEKQVVCLAQPLTPKQAGRYHLIKGVTLWIGKENTQAKLYFSAAKASSSRVSIPKQVFPPGHEIQETYASAPSLSETQDVYVPGYTFYFDGSETTYRPMYRPTIVQIGDDESEDEISWSLLLLPGDPMPALEYSETEADLDFEEDDADDESGRFSDASETYGGGEGASGLAKGLVDAPPLFGRVSESYTRSERRADIRNGFSDGWVETGKALEVDGARLPSGKAAVRLVKAPIWFGGGVDPFEVHGKRLLLAGIATGVSSVALGRFRSRGASGFGLAAVSSVSVQQFDLIYLVYPPKIPAGKTGSKTYENARRMGARNRIRVQRLGTLSVAAIGGYAGGWVLGKLSPSASAGM